ncbi:AMP-binding protein [Ramlibacter ginsenosidimutans]|uniref:AMP-binding protein n=1 Tax=Ramlibacter ginsenosidimutans TaxID=502333 RepID=A0A934TXR2_9BURK|nr:AMP-binding protein [Ramlibacter ginsenosidimutans]MBK6009444.1 AMP-binding protein [Ramlibacter ginsenosidimutans]
MAHAEPFIRARDFLLAHRTDYERACREFRWPQLDEFNWALDYFDTLAAGNDACALWIVEEDGREQKLSFRELAARSNRTANFLCAQGVRRGDRILLMLGNEVALWEIMLAAIKLGAVVIPATTLLTPQDVLDRVERGHVKLAIVAAASADKLAQVPATCKRVAVGGAAPGCVEYAPSAHAERFEPDGVTRATDPLLLYFTSGTTASPKLVLHSHQSYPVGHLSTMYWLGLQPGDVHLNISSPGWAKHAWSCFFAPWNAGACIFISNYKRFQATALLDVLASRGVTSLCAPPTVWRMLIQEDLAAYRGKLRLREVIGAGEPLNPEIIERVRSAWGLELRDGYGQTETTAQVGNSPGQRVKPGSMGRPLPGYQVVLLDAQGKESDQGEICLPLAVRPLGLMDAYIDSPERTAEATRDNAYHTGDIASRDADGYITYIGRSDDVFKASDYRISPFELESVLIEHPAVAEAAVVPSPDPLRLAVPKAFVVLAPGREPGRAVARDLFVFLRQQLPPFKRVRRIEFAELPKTISGKIRRVELRGKEAELRASGQRVALEFFEEDFSEQELGEPAAAAR